jgi:hypothetical protein
MSKKKSVVKENGIWPFKQQHYEAVEKAISQRRKFTLLQGIDEGGLFGDEITNYTK